MRCGTERRKLHTMPRNLMEEDSGLRSHTPQAPRLPELLVRMRPAMLVPPRLIVPLLPADSYQLRSAFLRPCWQHASSRNLHEQAKTSQATYTPTCPPLGPTMARRLSMSMPKLRS